MVKYTDGGVLYKKKACEWAMAIFFERANGAYGFMERYMYNFLVGKDVIRNDKEFVYMPEDEFLGRVISRKPILDFKEVYEDCENKLPDRMPWLEKLRYKVILPKQLDLDPENCKTAIEVHERRKVLIVRWFQTLEPYLENYELACRSFFPGVIPSIISRLEKSVSLLSKRDAELGLNDLDGIANSIKDYVKH